MFSCEKETIQPPKLTGAELVLSKYYKHKDTIPANKKVKKKKKRKLFKKIFVR